MQESDATDKDESVETEAVNSQPHDSASQRRYSSEEVADIIRLSLKDETRQSDNSVDYDELLAIAKEVGVDAENVDRAVHLLEEEQGARDKEAYLWSRFRTHCGIFIGANLLFIAMNVVGDSDTFWSMSVLFGWGLFLLGHYAGLLYAPQFVELAMERTQNLANNRVQEFFADDGTVGFKVLDNWDLTETDGMITCEDDKLVVEYQSQDSLIGIWQSKVKSVEIPISEITSIRLDRKMWAADLVMQGKRMRVFNNLPGSQGGALRVKINRQSQNAAAKLVQEVKERI